VGHAAVEHADVTGRERRVEGEEEGRKEEEKKEEGKRKDPPPSKSSEFLDRQKYPH
jgi:hypothetical protein